jgi:hypothetical protein
VIRLGLRGHPLLGWVLPLNHYLIQLPELVLKARPNAVGALKCHVCTKEKEK